MIAGRVGQFLGRLELTFGVDYFGAPLALGLRLPRHGALHLVRQVDMLDLDVGDLDPPGIGLPVEDLLQIPVDLSRFDSSSSSSTCPSTLRSVVCASWLVAYI